MAAHVECAKLTFSVLAVLAINCNVFFSRRPLF